MTTQFQTKKVLFQSYLKHVHIIAKGIQGHIQHDFLRQVASALKDHVSLQGSDLVVAGELGWVHDSSNVIALKGIKDLLSKPGQK